MPFNAGTVEGKLELDAKGFVDSLRRARKGLDSMAKQNKKTGSSLQTFSKVLGTVRDAVIVLPALFKAVTAPLRGLFNQLKEASGAAAEFQVTTRKLTTALALSGQQGAAQITERLKEFADALQETTGIGNTTTLAVAQTLTVLGVQQDQLEDSTTAVLNYSEAMGRDAVMASLQFGRTLSGLIGELGEALPAVRDLTQAELQAGEAFRVAGRLFAGTAEQVAQTTVGLRRSLGSAFEDFQRSIGDAINPVLDAITVGLKDAVESLTGLVRANEGAITDAFAGIARGVLSAIRKVLDFTLDVPVLVARAKALIFDIVAAFKIGGAEVRLSLLGVVADLQREFTVLLNSFSELPIVGDAFQEAAGNMLVATAKTNEEIRAGHQGIIDMTAGLVEASKGAKAAAVAAQEAADAIRDGSDQTSTMARGFIEVNNALDVTEKALDNIHKTEVKIEIATDNTKRGVLARLKALREASGISGEIKSTTEILAEATERATNNTEALANASGRAAAGFRDAAGAAGDLERATSAAESRRAGGRAGFNLDDPFSAIEALRASEAAARGAGNILSRRSAGTVTAQIAGAAQASVDRAISAFTDDLIAELNRAGVFDPAERQTFISDRISEAQRFGVLPPSTVGGSGAVGGIA